MNQSDWWRKCACGHYGICHRQPGGPYPAYPCQWCDCRKFVYSANPPDVPNPHNPNPTEEEMRRKR